MHWNWEKHQQAEKAFSRMVQIIAVLRTCQLWNILVDGPEGARELLTSDQLEELLRLGAEAAEDLHVLLNAIVPNRDAWMMQQINQARPPAARWSDTAAVNPPAEPRETV